MQLWDVADKPEQGHMPVRKFLGIWRKVDADVGLNGEAEIKFEWGDAATPAVHYTFAGLRDEGDLLVVAVEPVRATCKPRDEWWLSEKPVSELPGLQSTNACCSPARTDELIQGADAAYVATGRCCGNGAQAQSQATVCCN